MTMQLRSTVFEPGEEIPVKYGCKGQNINPPLTITAVPSSTKSLALIMDDPDVPLSVRKDQMWVHWVLYNLDPKETFIPEDCGAIAALGRNTGGKLGYMGPCPPDREHRYFFKLHALDCKLSLPEGSTKEELLAAMEGHILDQTELMGRYKKK